MQLQALSIRLMSTLTLFEILKFNEPIRSLTISGSFCANLSREGEDVKKEEEKETGRDMPFVVPLTALFTLSKSQQIKSFTFDGQLFD